jgi:hypothetical protein
MTSLAASDISASYFTMIEPRLERAAFISI